MHVDYLITGAGATGLSFLDVILSETDATVAIVDRRDVPGGHWNDAYPFVRLHQSASFYGVCSRPLNRPRKADEVGNAGLFELSTKSEILHYFHDLMENTYLPSGRVTYLPMSEHLGKGEVRSLLSGDITRLEVRKKFVNAGFLGDHASIPATHARSFDVADGVACVAINDLPTHAPDHDHLVIIGAGKTGMDAIVWLLDRGVAPKRITWVRPNDYWMFRRETILNHPASFETSITAFQAELEALGSAETVDAFCARLEEIGMWHRIDPDRWPTRFHAAVCSQAEIEALRRIENVIRAGYVTRIDPGKMVLEHASVDVPANTLFVDCTARGGPILGAEAPQVFDGAQINLCMVRPFQPLFSAALIAFLEAKVPDDDLRRACTHVVDFHDTPAEYVIQTFNGMMNQGAWNRIPELKAWIDTCRLYAFNHLLVGLSPTDTKKMEMLSRFGPLSKAAVENAPRLLASARAPS